MALSDFTRPTSRSIIKRYYSNQDQIQLQRLGEQVTELFLAVGQEAGPKVWKGMVTAMQKLGVPQSRIDHLVQQNDPQLIAKLVTELQGK